MTGRTCTVHGEYSATGVCRWCEPLPAPDAPPRLPAGHTRCRCGRMAWTEYAPRPFREEYDRVVHSPEQCYATAATPPADAVELPGMAGLWRSPDRVEWKDGVPSYFWDLGTFEIPKPTYMGVKVVVDSGGIGDAAPSLVSWPVYIPTPADLPIQPPVVLEYQHAALRWERVARRWAAKGTAAEHRMTVEGELAFDDHCAECRRTGRP